MELPPSSSWKGHLNTLALLTARYMWAITANTHTHTHTQTHTIVWLFLTHSPSHYPSYSYSCAVTRRFQIVNMQERSSILHQPGLLQLTAFTSDTHTHRCTHTRAHTHTLAHTRTHVHTHTLTPTHTPYTTITTPT